MATHPKIISLSRRILLEKFTRNMHVALATYYKRVQDKNIYHDEQDDIYEVTAVNVRVYLDFTAPIKVVKELGWYKEEDALPIIAYLIYESTFTPDKDDKLIVPVSEGYMSGTWMVSQVTQFGQGVPIAWALNVHQDRRFGTERIFGPTFDLTFN